MEVLRWGLALVGLALFYIVMRLLGKCLNKLSDRPKRAEIYHKER